MSSNSSTCLNDGALGPAVVGCRDDFDFTTLFEQLLLSITPSSCFLLLAILRIGYLFRKPGIVLARQFQFLKIATILLYAAIMLSLVILTSKSPVLFTPTSITAAVLSFVNALVFIGLSSLEHTRSLRSSTLLNYYLLLSLLFDAVQLRTYWLRDPSSAITTLFTAALAVKFGMLVLEAQGKSRWIKKDGRSPESISGIWSLSFFSWLNSLIIAGYRKILSLEDLFPLDQQLSIDAQRAGFQKSWKHFGKKKHLRLLRALLATLKWNLISPAVPRLAAGCFTFAQPFLINALLRYLQQNDETRVRNYGYGFIAASALIYVGIATSRGLYWYLHQRCLTVLRACLVSTIYQATMELNISGSDTSAPITLMNGDVVAIQGGIQNLHEYWASLIEAIVASWLLQQQLGSAFVAPILVVVLCSLAAVGFGRFVGKRQKAWMEAIQKRVGLTASIIPNMASIKMSGLAPHLQSAVQRWRDDELHAASRYRMFTTFVAVIAFTPLLISPVAAFGATNREVSTTRVFTSLAYISLLCGPLTQLFQTIPHLMAAITSLGRIEEFLDSISSSGRFSQDQDGSTHNGISRTTVSNSEDIELGDIALRPGVAVSIRDASFGWEQGRNVLQQINIDIPTSKLTVVTGSVGSGKSTLLKGILGETTINHGQVHRSARDVAFCDQQTFIRNASIRENIVAYGAFEPIWYERVIKATALDVDIAMLPKKDESPVGTKGVSLSGGQRQRIALARALYARKNIVLLDDVVSGLDHHTETHIFRQLLAHGGLFDEFGATIILCTPLVRHLSFADYIIVLENGTVSKHGYSRDIGPDVGVARFQTEQQAKRHQQFSETSATTMPPITTGLAVPKEDKARQLRDSQAYKYYLTRVGTTSLVLFFISGLIFAFLYNFGPVWLEFWSSSTARGEKKDHFYLGIYILLNVGCLVALLIYAGVAGISMTRRAGYQIHLEAITTLFGAQLSYFTSIDAGITTNIFSQVISIVDKDLSMNFSNTVLTGLTALGQAAVIATASPFILAGYPILMGVLYVLCRVYLMTSRQLRYLDIETKAPLYSHFLESVDGLATIRAFDWVNPSIKDCHRLLDESSRPDYLQNMVQEWLNLVLNMTIAVLAVIIIILATQLHTGAGFTGVGLVTLMSFGSMGANLVRIYAMLETTLAALSRLKGFTETSPQEEALEDDETLNERLILSGSVVFDHVTASYKASEEEEIQSLPHPVPNHNGLALRDISVSIAAGEKLAICGRSGSGKSSLLLVLSRLLNFRSGTVKVDHRSLTTIPRQALRSTIITLPQSPFYLPEGSTFRENLDSVNTDDRHCEYALRSVGLWELITERGGLDGELKSDVLSQGQKQLFSLARAILRARIALEQSFANGSRGNGGGLLLLDEVNSSVDHDTDMLMQEIIRREFQSYTVICVAHRLDAIRWYDRVVVMDKGQIMEVGSPEALIAQEAGVFRGLWMAGQGDI